MARPGPLGWALLSALLFGASTPACKVLLAGLSPVLLSGLLYAGAALAVSPWALRDLPALRGTDARNLRHLLGAALFGGVVGPVLLLFGLRLSPAGSVSLWLNLETVATALLARWFFHEHVGRRGWLAIALVVTASAILAPGDASESATAIALVALACVAWGIDNNLTAVIDRFTPAQVTFVKGVTAAAVGLGVGLHLQPATPAPRALAAALAVGALGYGASLLLYVASAQQLGALRAQLVFSTAPLWGLLLAWLGLGERLGAVHAVAALLMALSVRLWQREAHTHPHVHEPLTHRHGHRHDDGHHDHRHTPPLPPDTWHSHEHTHARLEHDHPHRPDLHHRHKH